MKLTAYLEGAVNASVHPSTYAILGSAGAAASMAACRDQRASLASVPSDASSAGMTTGQFFQEYDMAA